MLLSACTASASHVSQSDDAQYRASDVWIDLNLGQQHMTLLPVSRVFTDGVTRFSADADHILPELAGLIASKNPHWVAISIVSSVANDQERALAAGQADVLVRYFSDQPLGARMVYAKPSVPTDDAVGLQFFSGVNRGLAYIEIDYGGMAGHM